MQAEQVAGGASQVGLQRWVWVLAGLATLGAAAAGLAIGPADLGVWEVALELADRLPFVTADSGLSDIQARIVTQVRAPRVALGALVGACLAISGASYQAVFRNPLADPYLLGVAAGAGLGATIAIVSGAGDGVGVIDTVPLLAFVGALSAVGITYVLGRTAQGRSNPVSLLLAGIAVASFLAAVQTFLLQRNGDTIRQVYTWILGRLNAASWDEVWLLAPYALVAGAVLIAYRRVLDVMRLGDAEVESLGVRPSLVRAIIVLAASLATAAAVAVSGLIAFVGIIVPHTVRLVVGASNRLVLPLSMLVGAAFMMTADLVGRTLTAPLEIPIGVITAFCGAPFFLLVLRSSRRALQ